MSKVNALKELSLALDGGSFEKTGFEILEAKQNLNLGVWTVIVRAYQKEGELINHEDEVSLATLVSRLTNSYVSKAEWDIISVAKFDMQSRLRFELNIALKIEEEENETEDDSRVEEQVEA